MRLIPRILLQKIIAMYSTTYFYIILLADGEKYKFPEDNPFDEDSNDSDDSDNEKGETEKNSVASVGYRYRKWDLGVHIKNIVRIRSFSNHEIYKKNINNTFTIYSGNNLKLVARCEHDAVAQGTNNELVFLTTKALNEWDSRYICVDSVIIQPNIKELVENYNAEITCILEFQVLWRSRLATKT